MTKQMINYSKDTDNIVTLTLDMKGRAANVINYEFGEAFLPVIEHLKKEKARRALRGVILTSAKKSFLEGGDLEYLYRATDTEQIFRFAEKLKVFLRDLERPGVPVVAAINGAALGTGFELALACHHRILLDDPTNRIGNPEINLGLIPGGGATIRLMWLLGIERAYEILTSGKHYPPHEALQAGIIDELAHSKKEMMEKAKTWLMSTPEGRRPWDRSEAAIPGGTAYDPKTGALIHRLATGLSRHYAPAKEALLRVLEDGSKVDFDTACRIESRQFSALVKSKSSKNMIKAFWFDYHAIKGGEKRPKGFGRFRPKQIGVIGAGMMGSGIALACLRNKMQVVLKDVSKPIAERGREYVKTRVGELVRSGELLREEAADMLKRIKTTDTSADFASCDLVIEAVFENRMVKQKVTREAEAFMDEYSIFGTNTISIPITKLAETSSRPDNYVGLHFFHPADEVPLVEIVRGDKTSEETIARAFDFSLAIWKTPIIVKDDWGFYAARVQNTYLLEGITLLQEGYLPALIENLGSQAGMPKGALAMADDLGLDFALKYENQAAAHYGAQYLQHPAVDVLNTMIGELQRTGRNKRAGFYEYEEGEERRLWTGLKDHFPVTQSGFNAEEIQERLLFVQVIEAVWCMQEGVIQSIPEANLGSIYGWGFPASKGGVIQYVVDYGLEAFLDRCRYFEEAYGPRFRAPKFIRKVIGLKSN